MYSHITLSRSVVAWKQTRQQDEQSQAYGNASNDFPFEKMANRQSKADTPHTQPSFTCNTNNA